MELHDNLYALGLRLGREVFDDPESFRGALDDFLDEDAATTGDINLLVDAVRLGAFRSMTSMLDSGAEVAARGRGGRQPAGPRPRQRRRRRLAVGLRRARLRGRQGERCRRAPLPHPARPRRLLASAAARRPMLPQVSPAAPAPATQSPQRPAAAHEPPRSRPSSRRAPTARRRAGPSWGPPAVVDEAEGWPIVVAVVAVARRRRRWRRRRGRRQRRRPAGQDAPSEKSETSDARPTTALPPTSTRSTSATPLSPRW